MQILQGNLPKSWAGDWDRGLVPYRHVVLGDMTGATRLTEYLPRFLQSANLTCQRPDCTVVLEIGSHVME